ncbi:PLP-dependent aminotransferase family protein [Pedobacter sp. N36a]|uniref:aminotransferase-like domain-containing protein n=1 Tax=Pedobacter sp. N36a TaxID=2767996 RepID=UPI00165763EE|nr:PLP-dependent aminotransferase family protein [Pedobacter sp. N36a]MBC8986362.1 PLP-dependent aminotransferase family protein [Pedobacter sp. N36a]
MKTFQYLSLAAELENRINQGIYPIGDKLSSLRLLSSGFKVSIGTMLKALNLLIDKGLVLGRERFGYVVLRKAEAEIPLAKSVQKAEELDRRPLKLMEPLSTMSLQSPLALPEQKRVSFFNAVLDIQLLPLNAIRRSLQQASRDLTGAHLLYEQPNGNPLLRKEIAKRSFRWQGALSAEEVVITNGTLEAVGLCLRAVTKKGDLVVVQTPFYYGVLQMITALGLQIIELPGDTLTGIDVQELERIAIKHRVAACVLISNFNNPNGAIMPDQKKRGLAAFAARMEIPVIDDDIYGDLYFDADRPSNIKTFDQEGWVMLCSSFSKSVAPGYRIGWCAAGRFTQKVIKLKALTNVATATVVQLSLLQLLSTGAYDRHLRKLRPVLHRLMLLTVQGIEKYFPEGTRLSRPTGGLVLWLELPEGVNAVKLQQRASAKNIHIAPGPMFSSRGDYTNYIRISYSNIWTEKVETALRKLGELVKAEL